jgi:hypothetical protein
MHKSVSLPTNMGGAAAREQASGRQRGLSLQNINSSAAMQPAIQPATQPLAPDPRIVSGFCVIKASPHAAKEMHVEFRVSQNTMKISFSQALEAREGQAALEEAAREEAAREEAAREGQQASAHSFELSTLVSFVLPKGACFSVFLREDSYDGSRPFFAAEGSGTLEAYTPVMLQLSSTNHEQAGKGNGLKLRRVVPLARTVLSTFRDEFFASKMELEQAQARAAAIKALSATAKHMSGCPVLCRVSHTAFAFHDADVVELIESGVDPELGSKLLIPVAMLLEAMHSADVSHALRMLNVALGHGAVSCLVVASEDERGRLKKNECVVGSVPFFGSHQLSQIEAQSIAVAYVSNCTLKPCDKLRHLCVQYGSFRKSRSFMLPQVGNRKRNSRHLTGIEVSRGIPHN